jgi:hypothetical protein
MAIESYHYGIRDAKIATWTAANSYGTAVDVGAVHDFSITFQMENAALEGDDVIVDEFSKVKGVSINLVYGSVNQQVLSILTGGTLVSNADYEDLLFGQDDNAGYFALAGRVMGSGIKDFHIFVPKCKVMGNLQYKAGYGAYLIPQADIQGVWEGTVNGFARTRKFASATQLTIPLATAAG